MVALCVKCSLSYTAIYAFNSCPQVYTSLNYSDSLIVLCNAFNRERQTPSRTSFISPAKDRRFTSIYLPCLSTRSTAATNQHIFYSITSCLTSTNNNEIIKFIMLTQQATIPTPCQNIALCLSLYFYLSFSFSLSLFFFLFRDNAYVCVCMLG